MPRMPITKRPEPSLRDTVILGPCPGCYSWTIEYDLQQVRREEIDLNMTIELLLQEHLAQCPGLQEVVAAP